MRDLGVSAFRGTNVDQGAFGSFLEAIQSGKVQPNSVLVVESLDRVTRAQPFKSQHLILGILNSGVAIATIQPERIYEPGGENQLFASVEILLLVSRAHEESATKSKRVRAAWDEKRKNAAFTPMTGKCPAWLKLEGGKYVEVQPAADILILRHLWKNPSRRGPENTLLLLPFLIPFILSLLASVLKAGMSAFGSVFVYAAGGVPVVLGFALYVLGHEVYHQFRHAANRLPSMCIQGGGHFRIVRFERLAEYSVGNVVEEAGRLSSG
jgi:hypothetical protein